MRETELVTLVQTPHTTLFKLSRFFSLCHLVVSIIYFLLILKLIRPSIVLEARGEYIIDHVRMDY